MVEIKNTANKKPTQESRFFIVSLLSRPEIAIQKKKSLLWKNAAIM